MRKPDYVSSLEQQMRQQVRFALTEDIGSGDVTADLIPSAQCSRAIILSRESGLMCGQAWAEEVYQQLSQGSVQLNWLVAEGAEVAPEQPLVEMVGPTRLILTGERAALNFLQTLMGTARTTRHYLQQLPSGYQLLDTRKTLPGLRLAQKYAVWLAGGNNHRLALYDQFLIKENHIAAAGSIANAVIRARELHPQLKVEVEVETLAQLDQALALNCDYIMLDNFNLEMLADAWQRPFADGQLEISGGYELEDLARLPTPRANVRLSIGALTKHLQAHDLSLRLLPGHH